MTRPDLSAIRRRVEDAMGWASGVSLVGEANEHCRVLSDALTDLLDYAVRSGLEDVMTNTLKEPAVAAALERANNQKAEPHLGGRTARQSEIDAGVLADALNRLAAENEEVERRESALQQRFIAQMDRAENAERELAQAKDRAVNDAHQHALDMNLLKRSLATVQRRQAKAEQKRDGLAAQVEKMRAALIGLQWPEKGWSSQQALDEAERKAKEAIASTPASSLEDVRREAKAEAFEEATRICEAAQIGPDPTAIYRIRPESLRERAKILREEIGER